MFQKVIEVCFFLIVLNVVDADKSCPETDPDKPDIIPDKRDCTKFYICDNGLAWPQHCSDGLYFNPTLSVCDHPNNVVYCEYDDMFYIKPHCDCSKYIICNYGSMEVRECGQGYHFTLRSSQSSNFYKPCDPGDC